MSPSLISSLALMAIAAAPQDAPKATSIAPFVGENVAAVARFDLSRWQVPASSRKVLGKLSDDPDVSAVASAIDGHLDGLKKAGATELFLLIDPADLPGIPLVVVPLAPGADGRKLAEILARGAAPGIPWPKAETMNDAVVAGRPAALARLRAAKAVARPDVTDALAEGGDAAIRIALVPTDAQRRAIEESFPNLPSSLGGTPIEAVTRGMRWAVASMSTEPGATVRLTIRARNPEAAVRLRDVGRSALAQAGTSSRLDPAMGGLADAIAGIKPEVVGEMVRLEADLEKTTALVSVPVLRSFDASRKRQCIDNLKQIGLAMHNYHSEKGSFPSAYVAGKDGKPLVSWRVLILPYLDEKELFDQFHLDEPWDGPHNKPLIARMPKVYACPGGSKALAAEGKTTYLTPRGPATLFPGAAGIKIQDDTDGTSNTIMVVDAADGLATTWTKPDDWSTAPEFKVEGIFGHHANGTPFGFGDGSVKFLKSSITLKILQALTTRNGEEPLSVNDF